MVKEMEIEEFNNYIQDTLKIFKGLGSNNLEFIQGQHWFHLSYLTYQLSKDSRRLGILTKVLIFLTVVLLFLTAWNIWLLTN